MVMWCRAVGGDGWAHLPPSSWSKIELEEEEQRRKGCPRECALRAHAPSRAGWWPPVDNVRARVARRGVVSRVEHVVCGDAELPACERESPDRSPQLCGRVGRKGAIRINPNKG
jgi:hypothetical protein